MWCVVLACLRGFPVRVTVAAQRREDQGMAMGQGRRRGRAVVVVLLTVLALAGAAQPAYAGDGALAAKWAPYLLFSPRETYWPQNPGTYVQNVGLWWRAGLDCDVNECWESDGSGPLVPTGQIRSARLGG